MATDQGVGGSNPLTHVILYEKSRTDSPAFFIQRTSGSCSKGFGLRSAPVGAKRMSTGHPAPSHALPVRVRRGSIYAPLRSALNEDPPDLQRPLTHFRFGFEGVRVYALLRSVLNGCPLDIQHPLTHIQAKSEYL